MQHQVTYKEPDGLNQDSKDDVDIQGTQHNRGCCIHENNYDPNAFPDFRPIKRLNGKQPINRIKRRKR
jgi:hypothetical protein